MTIRWVVIVRLPEIEILVNNRGIYGSKAFEGIDDEWINFLQINVISGVRLSRKYLRLMLIKNWGPIIVISSELGSQDSSRNDSLRKLGIVILPGPKPIWYNLKGFASRVFQKSASSRGEI
ncbi:SDR family NAD(P)-dependent oxidoreductase [Microcoleus sp. B4-D4]|uniref:SDR family NAD(P)-dependent oxidoreductase n=1 Tax=Microcoleus sp. B4-D4 TaxID=2818667 RepID=UPI002FD1F612